MIELNQIDVLVSRYRHANVAYRHQERWKELEAAVMATSFCICMQKKSLTSNGWPEGSQFDVSVKI